MFDDPRKELARLQRELLNAQQAEEEYSDEDDEDLVDVPEDADRVLAEVKQMLAEDDWEDFSREPLDRRYIPYDEPEPTAARSVPAQSRASQTRPTRAAEAARPAKPRYGCLLTVLALETVGLILMAAWWYLWLK